MNKRGFTLIELVCVTFILSVITVIAIPIFKEIKMTANETWAITYMKAWYPAQTLYQMKDKNGIFAASDAALVRTGFLSAPDPGGTDPQICGYMFEIRGGTDMGDDAKKWWEGFADPIIPGTTGINHFYISSKDSGVIRVNKNGRAGPSDMPIGG